VVFCRGRELYTVQTESGRSRIGQTSFNSIRIFPHYTCYTLEEMGSVIDANHEHFADGGLCSNIMRKKPSFNSDKIMFQKSGTRSQCLAEMAELSEFACKIYEALLAENC
jgi:hypothetical protein